MTLDFATDLELLEEIVRRSSAKGCRLTIIAFPSRGASPEDFAGGVFFNHVKRGRPNRSGVIADLIDEMYTLKKQ